MQPSSVRETRRRRSWKQWLWWSGRFTVALLLALSASRPSQASGPAFLVKNINPAIDGSSTPENAVAVGNVIYFIANDGRHGKELWKSDGTGPGTNMVKDIYPGVGSLDPEDIYPGELTNVNGTLFFVADDGSHGVELWKSDGTNAGTVMVKDIYPG